MCCKTCIQDILPFCNKKIDPNKIKSYNAGVDSNLKKFLCQLNNLSEKENIDNENFSNLHVELQSKCLSFFHFNINSFSKNVDNFNFDHLIKELKLEFHILGILKSRILKQFLNTNVSLQNYVIEQTSTESTAGVALLCINERPSRNLAIYKAKKLESIFVEVVLSKKINLIIEYIYKHPCMDIYTFIYDYFNPL